MVSSAERFLGDETEPNSVANEWGMSDAPAFFGEDFIIPTVEAKPQKTEEERSYEQKERGLQDELFAIADRRVHFMTNTGDEFIKIMKGAEHPFANRLEKDVDNLTSGKRRTSHATLETFFSYVDSMYPSTLSGQERDLKTIEQAEDEFRRASIREGQYTGDSSDTLAKAFREDGSDNDFVIAQHLKNIGDNAASYGMRLPQAVVGYLNDPSRENRTRLSGVQVDHKSALSNSLYNIATTFDNSRTIVGKKMVDPSFDLLAMMSRSNDEYFEGMMDYLKFKMNNSKYHQEEKETPSKYEAMFNALPGDAIS